MKIVVAGGSGFLGRYICRALMDAGHSVTVLARDSGRVASIPQLAGARAASADVTDPASLRGALGDAQAVVGAVQFPNHPIEVPRKGLTYDRYDRLGTENLLGEAARAGVERYVYVSGARADARSPKSWYRAKGRAEEAVRASGLAWSILRPSWAYGPEDRALNVFAAIARFSPVVPVPGLGPQLVQPVYVEDIGLAVRRIFEEPAAWERVFEIGSREIMTMTEIVQTLLETMGKRRVVLPVPKTLVQFATAPLVVLPRPPMTPQGVEFAVQDGLVDIAELEKILDVHPVPLREGLSRYIVP